jgi:hypothetical protein
MDVRLRDRRLMRDGTVLGRKSEHVLCRTNGHEVTCFRDWMPRGSRHLIGHLLVDHRRYKPVIKSLPEVNAPFDSANIKTPGLIEPFSIANQTLTSLGEAFGSRFAEGCCEVWSLHDLLVVGVDGLQQSLDVGRTGMHSRSAQCRIHQAEARQEAQGRKATQRMLKISGGQVAGLEEENFCSRPLDLGVSCSSNGRVELAPPEVSLQC